MLNGNSHVLILLKMASAGFMFVLPDSNSDEKLL
jgi:hypothetical protein